MLADDQLETHLFNGLLLKAPDGSHIFAKLTARMKETKTPGISYAIVKDNNVVSARALGESQTAPSEQLSNNTLFSAASISKTATGLLCARLHELGKIDLDRSINDYFKEYNIDFRLRQGVKISEEDLVAKNHGITEEQATELYRVLRNYQVITEDGYFSIGHASSEQMPKNLIPFYDFLLSKNAELRKQQSDRKEVARTLRQILAHSAGISVAGLPGYSVDNAPTHMELLAGSKKSLVPPIEVIYDAYEGDSLSQSAKTNYHYSGGGYILVEVLLERIFNQKFEDIVATYLFRDLGMTESTFVQTGNNIVKINGEEFTKAQGYDEDGDPTHYNTRIFPAKSMAGLWSTPSDIAKMTTALNNSLNGSEGAYLSQKMAEQVLEGAGQKTNNERVGLGVFSSEKQFAHSGYNPGFESYYFLNRDGSGGVWMLNGKGLTNEVRHAVNFILGKTEGITTEQVDATSKNIDDIVGDYEGREFKLVVETKDGQFFATLFQRGLDEPFQGSSFPIYPIKGGKFAANSGLPFPIYFTFTPEDVNVEHKEMFLLEGYYRKSIQTPALTHEAK